MSHGRNIPWGILYNNPGQLTRPHDASVPHDKHGDRLVYRSMNHGLIGMAREMRNAAVISSTPKLSDWCHNYARDKEIDAPRLADHMAQVLYRTSAPTHDVRLRLTTAYERFATARALVLALNGPPSAKFSIGGEWFHPATIWAAIEQAVRL